MNSSQQYDEFDILMIPFILRHRVNFPKCTWVVNGRIRIPTSRPSVEPTLSNATLVGDYYLSLPFKGFLKPVKCTSLASQHFPHSGFALPSPASANILSASNTLLH